MNNIKVLFLCTIVMISTAANGIILGGDACRSVSLEEYLSAEYVDAHGQTFLHHVAQYCDDDNFEVNIKLFDYLENKLPMEVDKFKKMSLEYKVLEQTLPDLADVIMAKMIQFIQLKDNNGDTALDLAKKRNAINPHTRCTSCVEFLELFDTVNVVK